VLKKKVQACHPKEHKQGIHAGILRKVNMIGHESQAKSARKGDERRERSRKKIDHRDGEDPED
jgi:hypothetical protein